MCENKPQCASCKHWTRSQSYGWPEENTVLNVGRCAALGLPNNTLHFVADEEEAQKEVQASKIGCTNLFTHELFGCIHYTVK